MALRRVSLILTKAQGKGRMFMRRVRLGGVMMAMGLLASMGLASSGGSPASAARTSRYAKGMRS